MNTNSLYFGDCLEWMKEWNNNSIDLIYLDPPFNSNRKYNQFLQKDAAGDAQFSAFNDTWVWDNAAAERWEMFKYGVAHSARGVIVGLEQVLGKCGTLAYLTYMAERLEQMHRLLKVTGHIVLHCDPTASHYLKVVMDAIFGVDCFRNEIVWKRKQEVHNRAVRTMGASHDVLLWYGHPDKAKYRKQFTPYSEEYIKKNYNKEDERGRFSTFPCTNRRGGNKAYEFRGITAHWRFRKEEMERRWNENLLTQATKSSPFRYKKYLEDAQGVPLQDIWLDIKAVRGKSRTDYDTEKPLPLLKRIIESLSDPGDIVLDPFCGCGTTCVAARDLKRQFLGVDISSYAVELVRDRRLNDPTIEINGIPFDMRSARVLAKQNRFNFESWAITRLDGFMPNLKQRGDGGIDGKATIAAKIKNWDSQLALAQVKSGKPKLGELRDFVGVTHRENAVLGCFITLNPWSTPDANREATELGRISIGSTWFPRMQIWSIDEYFKERRPRLPVMKDPYSGKPMNVPQLPY